MDALTFPHLCPPQIFGGLFIAGEAQLNIRRLLLVFGFRALRLRTLTRPDKFETVTAH